MLTYARLTRQSARAAQRQGRRPAEVDAEKIRVGAIAVVAKEEGCSPKTLRRDFKRMFVRFGPREAGPASRDGSLCSVRVPGERAPRLYRRRVIAFGGLKETWLERVSRRTQGARRGAAVKNWMPVRVSPMTRLFAALVSALSVEALPPVCDQVSGDTDWSRNLAWATARARRRLGGDPPWPVTKVIRVLGRHDKDALCRWCYAPLLAGGWLPGGRITRAKEFCEPACKVALSRWLRRRR